MKQVYRAAAILLTALAVASPAGLTRAAGTGHGFRVGQLGLVRVIIRGLGEQPPRNVLRRARVLDPLYTRYLLRTVAREKARIEFRDHTQLNINQLTDAVLSDSLHLVLHRGEIDQVDSGPGTRHVSVNGVAVGAIGTNFDIKVVNGRVVVTVVQGRVTVRNAGATVALRPNQQTTVTARARPSRPRHVNAQAVIAWVRGLDTQGWISLTSSNQDTRAFSSVTGLAAAGHHVLYAATDAGITQFSTSGRKVRSFGPRNGPYGGLALDRAGHLYLGTPQGISEYSASGTRIRTLSAGPGFLTAPAGLAVDSTGALYATNTGKTGLVRFAPGSSTPQPIGGARYSRVHGVAVDQQNNVYVVAAKRDNPNSNIVEKYSPAGKRLKRWAITGPNGTIPLFADIAVSKQGRIFLSVPEIYSPRIHGVTGDSAVYELTKKGKLRTIWERPRRVWPAAGSFLTPSGIAVDKQGNVYVGDNYRLQKIPWFDT